MPRLIHQRRWLVMVAVVISVLTAAPANALIVVTPTPDHPANSAALVLTSEVVRVDLTDRAAEVSVECTYHNSSAWILEGTYLFPLPPEAAVDRFSLYVNGEEIHAELLDVDQARQTYESIVRRMKDPALLEYADRQLLKARIFPIQPNSDAKIRLYYTHPLVADFGTTDFVFPFSTERGSRNASVSLVANIKTNAPLKAVTSPTHEVTVSRDTPRHATATVGASSSVMDADFHLLCTYDNSELGAQFLTTTDDSGVNYFMAIIAPGETSDDDVLPKDVVFCFDHSGSMAGEKIKQARAALRFCLDRLNPEDRFSLIVFNDGISPFSRTLRVATPALLDSARLFVDKVVADGGTFIEEALARSLDLFEDSDRPRYLIFLTDGQPTVGPQDPQIICNTVRTRNTHGVRVFTFGVGHDLNAALLNDLAGEGHGQASYVAPNEDVEVAVSNFFRKINRPVLSNCSLEFTGVDVSEVYPRDLPDVYAGMEIVAVGRFESPAKATARLLGTRGKQSQSHRFPAEFSPKPGRYTFIPKLWAGRRIGYLLEDMRKNGETAEVKDEVVRLSKKYGIMTPYTAFLAAPEAVRIASIPPPRGEALSAAIRNLPVTDVGDVLKTQVGVAARNDRFHVRGGRSEEVLYGVKKSVSEAKLKDTQSTAALQDQDALEDTGDSAPSISAAGRQFTLINGIWTDWSLLGDAKLPADTIVVKPFSDAYFRLNRIPGMAGVLAVGDRVAFLWRNCVIKIDETGAEIWNPAWNRLL